MNKNSTKTRDKSYRKVFNMKGILSSAFYIVPNSCKEIKMSIEYHLQKPSIGIFLWAVVTESLGGNVSKKPKNIFDRMRDEFHKEYVLPLGLALGYSGVVHSPHFERDFFSPFYYTEDGNNFPSIKGHDASPHEENRTAYATLVHLEQEVVKASRVIPSLCKQLFTK